MEINISVSKFKGYIGTAPETVNLIDFLKDDTYKNDVQKIRSLSNKDEIRELKKKLPSITPSGTFTTRKASELISHSGLICIDIDGQDNTHISDFALLRDELKRVKNVFFSGLSVSGKGVFCLIKLKYPERHKEHFEALKIIFKKLGISIDKQCGDVCRLRGYSWDENAYFNFDAETFTQYLDPIEELEKKMRTQSETFTIKKKV